MSYPMFKKSTFRVITPVFNPPPAFIGHLAALERNCPGVLQRFVLVDDASTNGVVEQAKRRFPEIEIIHGNGNLWWCGGMRAGMARALELEVDAVVWLNHDCLPDPETIPALVAEAARPGTGVASAWCYCREDRRYCVNPGFRSFREIPVTELEAHARVQVDGTNGNCVAISTIAIRKIGLPRADLHPHYGDGPYTFRIGRAGFTNLILPLHRASLEREFERCVDEEDHASICPASFLSKLGYYFFSNRSKFHWRNRFHDLRVFRGRLCGPITYPFAQLKLASKVWRGHRRLSCPLDERIEHIVGKYQDRFPEQALRDALTRLARSNA